jgi:hypothetical protein
MRNLVDRKAVAFLLIVAIEHANVCLYCKYHMYNHDGGRHVGPSAMDEVAKDILCKELPTAQLNTLAI